MIFESVDDVVKVLKGLKATPKYIENSRKESKELKALISGKDFVKELISKIEHIEGEKRAEARKKYSRSIKDFFERLLRPIDNIYSATGGSRRVELKGDNMELVFKQLSNIKGGVTLHKWVEDHWMNVYHNDPGGLVFLEYEVVEERAVSYPTYKSIDVIRHYEPKGQKIEYVVFEPKTGKDGEQIWRVVDDLMNYVIIEKGDSYSVLEDFTFEHPFGECPGVINSNIVDILDPYELRKSPVDTIVGVSKEYARDQSVKTIYKFLHGVPIQWRYVTQCRTCHGTGKDGSGNCQKCDGKGFYESKDVTDLVNIPTPKKDEQIVTPDIAGFISPDLETWESYTEELEYLEKICFNTHWGTHVETGKNETATGRFIDIQPVINRLNKYADVSQWVEKTLAEWMVNGLITSKSKEERVIEINYGRRYIIEGPDVILERYEKAKEKGDNTTILDRLFNEYLTSKYKNDPKWLHLNLKKADVEPYLHYTPEQVSTIFGPQEAQKKILFEEFWKPLDMEAVVNTDTEKLKTQFSEWVKGLINQNSE